MKRIAVVGSRDFNNYQLLEYTLNKIVKDNKDIVIVSGGARGADALAEQYADKRGFNKLIFLADWKKHGKRAGYLRNHYIIKHCDFCVCFWDGQSRGTAHDIELCDKYNKPCLIVKYLEGRVEFCDSAENFEKG